MQHEVSAIHTRHYHPHVGRTGVASFPPGEQSISTDSDPVQSRWVRRIIDFSLKYPDGTRVGMQGISVAIEQDAPVTHSFESIEEWLPQKAKGRFLVFTSPVLMLIHWCPRVQTLWAAPPLSRSILTHCKSRLIQIFVHRST